MIQQHGERSWGANRALQTYSTEPYANGRRTAPLPGADEIDLPDEEDGRRPEPREPIQFALEVCGSCLRPIEALTGICGCS